MVTGILSPLFGSACTLSSMCPCAFLSGTCSPSQTPLSRPGPEAAPAAGAGHGAGSGAGGIDDRVVFDHPPSWPVP